MLAFFLLLSGCNEPSTGAPQQPVKSGSPAAESAASEHASAGTLRVWVPVGAVGGRYWIYLNGHIAAAPKASDTTATNSGLVVASFPASAVLSGNPGSGWDIVGPDIGWQHVRHDVWGPEVAKLLTKDEPHHLFTPVDLALPAGDYTVELMVESAGQKSGRFVFPLPITRGRVVTVSSSQTASFVGGIPDAWSAVREVPAAQAARLCPGGAAPPDLDGFKRRLASYKADPMTRALRGASDLGEGLVLLKLPPSLGGPREFDGQQLKTIVEALAATFDFPADQDVAECEERYPEYSSSYREFGELLREVLRDIEGFRQHGDRLISQAAS